MEPVTIVAALAGAMVSLFSALLSSYRERKAGKISVLIGGKEIKITSANRKEIEEALSKIEDSSPASSAESNGASK